ncbi:beta-ketoacyl synthase N-terminal-like domain-containing protein [Streptomyces sp. NPDC003038]|uniref:beta-ketoacyl synthase N-terminal-like domain-containing protein n=1 Tax=unclassified Streptomyces TaxID=2593676 RepID=UPI0033AD8351
MSDDGAIAVIGAGCRFPDAWNPSEYWRNIAEGRVSIRELDPAALLAAGLTERQLDDPAYVRRAAGIPAAGDFAAEFFGYSPAEAAATDPQQRIFLEACWQAMEAAGHAPSGDPLVTGVFAGGSPSTYTAALQASRALTDGVMGAVDDVALHLGGLGDFLPSRVAYKLGLRGPSIGVQTACSSSLTAVHYAVLSLLSGECDMALAGGASVNEPMLGYRFHAGGLQSQDGYCRPFDARSTGTSFSSGVGVVVLRRLGDALRAGDPVLAVLHGTAVGNDGSARSGFTAPSPSGLADVVAAALDVAGVRGDQLRYVEAHGSGTPLGDQIELRGLTAGIRAGLDRACSAPAGFCGLGSVKANIGHAGPAAGIAGLIKAVQVARTGELPPHPMFERPRNPGVLAESPFTIAPTPTRTGDDAYVLVNSMGLGGTNATAVLGPPPAPTGPAAPQRESVRLVLSARTLGELAAVAEELAGALTAPDAPALADAAHTLRVGRTALPLRSTVTGSALDPAALAAQLRAGAVDLRAGVAEPPKTLRRVVLVPPAGPAPDPAVLTRLSAAFKGRAETAAPGQEPRADRFAILLGGGESGGGRHVLALDGRGAATDEALEAAVTAAWAHGADVDWEALGGPAGRRVPLPAYPFVRGTYWALDTLPPIAAPPRPTSTADPAPAAGPVPAADTTAGPAGESGADPVMARVLEVWRRVLGHSGLGPDDEFGDFGGDSLTSMRIEASLQREFAVTVNVFRAGGAQATVRRMAGIVRAATAPDAGQQTGAPPRGLTEADLVVADLALPIGPVGATGDRAGATDTLLTSGSGFLDTFVLHELVRATSGLVHVLVPAADEDEARDLLRERALACALPVPDPQRVRVLCGDGTDAWQSRPGLTPDRIARVVHTAASVDLHGAYEQVREDSVLPMVSLLTWMRGHGIDDLVLLSTLSACGSGLGADARIEESREQPLVPGMHGGAVASWVTERLAERAEGEGMRVRVFRTGLLLGDTSSGACDPDHPLWRLIAGALATGVHPRDERPLAVSPVDLASRAIAELALSPASEGRAYHLVGETTVSALGLFELLTAGDRPTRTVSERAWQREVALRALDRENEALDPLAVRGLRRFALAGPAGSAGVEAQAWRPWLDRGGHDPNPTAHLLIKSLDFATTRRAAYAELLDLQGTR